MDKNFRTRLSLCFFVVALLGVCVIVRSGMLTLIPSKRLGAMMAKQFRNPPKPKPERGLILDRNREPLAVSLIVRSLYAHPDKIIHKKKLSRVLAKIFKARTASISKKIRGKKKFVWIKRRISKKEEEAIRALWRKDPRLRLAINFIKEGKRFYPNQQLASHVLGFVGVESQGLEGLEYLYDKKISGISGTLSQGERKNQTLVLTLDKNLQHAVEKELRQGIEDAGARSGTAIVMDASTGDIRAMASFPTYNPNDFNPNKRELMRNRAISQTFEPGSTLKSLVALAALEERIALPGTKFFCEMGRMKVGKHWIRESQSDHKWGWLSVKDILKFSSNVGATKIGFRLGAKKLDHWLRVQKFGVKTGVDLPGEENGFLRPYGKWSQVALSNISFGQGLSVTPLQLVRAYAIIANGGFLVRPRIVEYIEDSRGKILERMPIEVSRVVKESSAQQMQEMLVTVTQEGGTGTKASIPGFEIGGKTGTAQVAERGKGYVKERYVASFIGFPRRTKSNLVALVVIWDPKLTQIFGGEVAAPIFQKIMRVALALEGEPKNMLEKIVPKSPPEVSERKLRAAALAAIRTVQKTVQKTVQPPLPPNSSLRMPNLLGSNARTVLDIFHKKNIQLKVRGHGVVVRQYPAAGSIFRSGDTISVTLSPVDTL